jgi:hypothetical protein
METATTVTPTDLRTSVRCALRDAWIATRTFVQPRLVSAVKRIEHALGVLPQREWFDRVDLASDDSFPASDPPSFSSPNAGEPRRPVPS